MQRFIKDLLAAARKSADLVRGGYRVGSGRPLEGLCYPVCEIIFRAFPGAFHLYRVRNAAGGMHYFLRHADSGALYDPTAEQFPPGRALPFRYEEGRRCAPLTRTLSKRAQTLVRRMFSGR